MAKTKICKGCGTEIYKGAKRCPQCGKKNKKHIFLVIICILLCLIAVKMISNSISEKEEQRVTYEWPTMGIATLLPEPETIYGRVGSESETYFSIDIYGVEIDEYRGYVTKCKERGFVIDYSGSDSRYYAKDSAGNDLSIYYDEDDKEMSVSLSAFKEQESTKNEEEKGSSENVSTGEVEDTTNESEKATEEPIGEEIEETSQGNIEEESSSENDMVFREWVDSYETFMNEYANFMNKFAESDGSDLTLLLNYAEYMSKYAEFMEKTGEIDESELTVEDYAYYMEAQARVLKKLSEVQ